MSEIQVLLELITERARLICLNLKKQDCKNCQLILPRVKALRYFIKTTEQILQSRNFRDEAGAILLHPSRLRNFDPDKVIAEIIEIAQLKSFSRHIDVTYMVNGDETFQEQLPNLKGDVLRFH